MKKLISSLFFFLFCLGQCGIYGQTAPKNNPFDAGERLTYEVKLSKTILRGISVADLSFTVADSSNGKNYLIITEGRSKGTLTRLFKLSFFQKYESTVDREKFRILKTVKHDEQDERVRESESVFDYQERQVTYTETDPKDFARPPRRIASAISEDTHDVISGVYNLRRLPLAVGKMFELSVSDSGLVYKIPVRVTARERQDSIIGKVWCFRVEPEVFGTKRFIEDKGKMIIWITDDARRIPVRSQIQTSLGKIEVKLKRVDK